MMFKPRFSLRFLLICATIFSNSLSGDAFRQKTVFQRISTEEKFSTFNSLLQNSSLVRRAIIYWNTTVFVPTNEAFAKFKGALYNDIVYYHVSNELKSLRMIFESNNIQTLADGYPPLWVSRIDSDIFINNAKIDAEQSDYYSRASGGFYNYNQALHIIDQVLEPPNKYLDNPSALDIISNYTNNRYLSTKKYLDRIKSLKLTKLFKNNTGSTYFVPVDAGFDDYRYRITDRYIVEGHIIPNQVLFTRPTIKNFYFETKSNGEYIYILVSFVYKNKELYIRSNTILGDSNHHKGELWSKVLKGNIPVKNGVVHLIEKPLAIFDLQLNPFPFLPILTKLSGDPELNITFHLGEKTEFNEYLRMKANNLLTFFVPRDRAWNGVLSNITDVESLGKLLGRHLIISDMRYTLEKLWYRTFNKVVTMNTVSGAVDIEVLKDSDGNYSILYYNKRIKVHRPDYICTNGIIHIIDEPFIDIREKNAGKLKMNFWKTVEDFVF
ncbi:fasciclin-1-like [Coccinella septempunctata]|uniref:fasciclin-1-like n=1 Tax=Coccinella septempunctata TaxID=41139 RepID=UPI001D07CFC7|nr:fasciclin-1-like [Coccinella septempunctata]